MIQWLMDYTLNNYVCVSENGGDILDMARLMRKNMDWPKDFRIGELECTQQKKKTKDGDEHFKTATLLKEDSLNIILHKSKCKSQIVEVICGRLVIQ